MHSGEQRLQTRAHLQIWALIKCSGTASVWIKKGLNTIYQDRDAHPPQSFYSSTLWKNLARTEHAQGMESRGSRGAREGGVPYVIQNKILTITTSFHLLRLLVCHHLRKLFPSVGGVKSCRLLVGPSCRRPVLSTMGRVPPTRCPDRPPGRRAPLGRCPSSWSRGSRGRSDWIRILSCGGSRSTPQCPTRPWCWTCRWWRWGVCPRPWSAASAPGQTKA